MGSTVLVSTSWRPAAKDTLDPINQFVTPDTFEGNGWHLVTSGVLIVCEVGAAKDQWAKMMSPCECINSSASQLQAVPEDW